jgi:Orsellinic acid/F9775 biosynthesis cluster protein D
VRAPNLSQSIMTHSNDNKYQTLIESVVYYNVENRLAICRLCGTALPDDAASHLRQLHSAFSCSERVAIVKYINTLNKQPHEEFNQKVSFRREIDAIEGLPIHERFHCQIYHELGAKRTIVKHCREKHNWTSGCGTLLNCCG